MHDLFRRVLIGKNLSKAGELFSLEDNAIIQELPEILSVIHDTISTPEFLINDNDQSLVEIVVARLTSAIRETRSIELCAPHLVSLLRTCLSYNLRPTNGEDPPHAKISSDIMSCLFLNYNKKKVMRLTIPLSVKFLHKGNRELSRNMSSYLALAAIENAESLSAHLQPIIDSVITGNYSLARVLPQIYGVNKEPIINHVMTLVSVMPNCDRSGKLALLSLFALIAKDNASLLESSVPQISEGLSSSSTATATLQVFYSMVVVKVSKPLLDHIAKFKEAAVKFPKTIPLVSQILCAISLSRQDCSQDTMDFMLSKLDDLETDKHALILKELAALAARYPSLLTEVVLSRLSRLEKGPRVHPSTKAYIQELRQNLSLSDRVSLNDLLSCTNSTNSNNNMNGHRITSPSDSLLHNSIPKLSSSKLNKSLNRLISSSSQVSVPTSQNNTPTNNNNNNANVYPNVTSSVSCISSNHNNNSKNNGGKMISGLSGVVGGGASSPTKSMSSGSVPFASEALQQVVKVNVSQINQDLIRQVSSVQSYKDLALLSSVVPHKSSDLIVVGGANSHWVARGQSNGSSRRNVIHNSGPIFTSGSNLPQGGSNVSAGVGGPPGGPRNPPGGYISSSYQSITHEQQNQPVQQPSLRKSLSNTLPNQRRKKILLQESYSEEPHFKKPPPPPPPPPPPSSNAAPASPAPNSSVPLSPNSNNNCNRMSIFEPYPLRDAVQHFCEKHLTKIKNYMEGLIARLPLPVKCTIEERKGKKHAKLHFACQGRVGDYCLYKNTFYSMKTRNPKIWIHIMFLSLQARSSSAISTRESSVSSLKNCWEILKYETIPFVTLVTGAFPPPKEQDNVLQELRANRFFDVFEYNGPKQHWGCFLCNHPDRATCFVQEQEPVIEGQLKEKKGGRWKVFKKWKSRYFTLSGAKLSYKESPTGNNGMTQSLDVDSIRSVKVSRNGRRNIPKAFEIFTNERTFVLKAKDSSNAQEWIQCLSVAKARSQVIKAKSNSSQTL